MLEYTLKTVSKTKYRIPSQESILFLVNGWYGFPSLVESGCIFVKELKRFHLFLYVKKLINFINTAFFYENHTIICSQMFIFFDI